ncbi:hypothetical protein P167DRAFT_578041 [Morchella conica CCBAS932]|uniref:Uncharacterized protein n=1 Tax=Morchella conica CCBAS932 TaxID=1392247 RepID=A0A3N4KDS2_9PEZI|nr:hypothetical protein P167DRAFT_578041 [Morchella conica CCBAS932]
MNSSLVDAMVDAGGIPSRMWGMDYGWVGGRNVGYVGRWRAGVGRAFPENLEDSDGCALIVYITGITMKNSTDSPDLMESKGDSLRWACISPDYDLMTMPYDLFTVFNSAMDGVYVNRTTDDFYLWKEKKGGRKKEGWKDGKAWSTEMPAGCGELNCVVVGR